MHTLKRILGAAVAGAGLVAALSMSASAAPQFVKGTIDADGGLNGRIAPSVHADTTYVFADGDKVGIDCQTKGTIVGETAEWYLISGEGDASWVSAAYVDLAGDEPAWCGPDETVPVTLTEDTQSYQGPSTEDDERRFQEAGEGQEVLCYTYTATGGNERWYATIEDGWIPADHADPSAEIPFCES